MFPLSAAPFEGEKTIRHYASRTCHRAVIGPLPTIEVEDFAAIWGIIDAMLHILRRISRREAHT